MEYTSTSVFSTPGYPGYQTCDLSRRPSGSQLPRSYNNDKRKRKHTDQVSNELQCQHPNIITSPGINDIPVKKRKAQGK